MAEATYRLMTDAAGQRIAEALENLITKVDLNNSTIETIKENLKEKKDSESKQNTDLETLINQNEIVVVTPNFSSLPQTFYDPRVTKEHEFIVNGYALLSNPAAECGNWEVNFYDGYYTINGYIDGTTNITMSLHIPSSIQTGIANA